MDEEQTTNPANCNVMNEVRSNYSSLGSPDPPKSFEPKARGKRESQQDAAPESTQQDAEASRHPSRLQKPEDSAPAGRPAEWGRLCFFTQRCQLAVRAGLMSLSSLTP